MFGKKRILQKTPRSTERPPVNAGTSGRAEHPHSADALIAVKQQLQQEIADRKLGEDRFKIHLDRLEQRIKGQSGQLIKIEEHLKHLREELTEKLAVLTNTTQQLQHEVGDLSQKEVELLADISDARQSPEESAVLDPQELKTLSDLAKRLAQ